jgi:hypothetical protein
MTRLAVASALIVLCAACSGSNPAPAPTPAPASPAPAPPAPVRITGHVIATNGGQGLGGVAVTLAGASATTDSGGFYALSIQPGASGTLTLSGSGIVARSLRFLVNAPNDRLLDVFGPGFDLAFYRLFARNGLDAPTALQPIRRWNQAPKIYLRTVDDAGQAVDAVTLDTTAAALINNAGIWSGHVFGLAAMEQGMETREGVSGWLTVKFTNPPEAGICGRAQVGSDGGWITLNAIGPNCGWHGSRVAPLTTIHELGHAFGYWHTGVKTDVMYGGNWSNGDLQPSAREQEYARYVYSRPIGNTDPDVDPATPVLTFATQRFVD